MYGTTLHPLRRFLSAVAAAALLAGCADGAPLGPQPRPATPAPLSAAAGGDEDPDTGGEASVLGACEILKVPAGNRRALRVYAEGVQIYRWNGATWDFVAPRAELYAVRGSRGVVGTHYAGPTWESNSGGTVVGAVVERCTPHADAIPWLLLEATATDGPGIFRKTSFIQRVRTTGGNAPPAPGGTAGEEARVPYTAEYVFYRAW